MAHTMLTRSTNTNELSTLTKIHQIMLKSGLAIPTFHC